MDDIVSTMGCHRRPDRSFFYHGKQFPVCARCTGVFIGEVVGILGFFLWKPSILLCLCLCAVMFVDWFIQYLELLESTNIRRLITGLLGGYGYTGLLMWGAYKLLIYAHKAVELVVDEMSKWLSFLK